MVVDIGGGTTEVAVISLGGIVVSRSIRVGGDELDSAIIDWVKKEHNVLVGERTAEQLKIAMASAWPYSDEPSAEVRGRDLVTGLPKTILLTSQEVREAIEEPTQAIVDAVKYTLDKTRLSWRRTSWSEESCSPGEEHCWSGWTIVWLTRRGCPSSRRHNRCSRWCSARGSAWRNSTPCTTSWCLRHARDSPSNMLSRQPGDRTLPTLVTLLVIGLLLMTFDVRSEGGGVTGVLRSGTQSILSPLQKGTAFVVNPVVDIVDSLSNLASLREENLALRQELAEAEAALVALDDDLARLELYEQLYELEATTTAVGRTVANVIGQPDAFDGALIIDKGSAHGIAPGQPVIDTSGFVVGSVLHVSSGTATIVPITVGPSGVAVAVGDQIGTVVPIVTRNEMRLELDLAQEPVFAGDRVVTSSRSVNFPAGYPVGEVIADAAPTNDLLVTTIVPYVQPDTLRVVVVLAWPPDPITAVTDTATTTTTSTTTTTVDDGSTTTSTTEGA
jgi:rod shape-determining protein MreC